MSIGKLSMGVHRIVCVCRTYIFDSIRCHDSDYHDIATALDVLGPLAVDIGMRDKPYLPSRGRILMFLGARGLIFIFENDWEATTDVDT